jgi:hypothetical protein
MRFANHAGRLTLISADSDDELHRCAGIVDVQESSDGRSEGA